MESEIEQMLRPRVSALLLFFCAHAWATAAVDAAQLPGVNVELEDYDGSAELSAQLVEKRKLRIEVTPNSERQRLAIRVELPFTGRNAWPIADVEVRNSQGRPVAVRRSGIEWHRLLIPVPAVAETYYVQAVDPPAGAPATLPDQHRQLVDANTGLTLTVARWYDGRQAALSIRFDDSHPTHLTKAIPILRAYGFRGTFMVNPGDQEPGSRRRMAFADRRDEWEAVAGRGDQEFANHSAHHRGAGGDEEMEAEIGEAARTIWKLFPEKSKLTALNLGGGTTWETTRTLRYYLDKYHHFDASQNSLGMDDVYGGRVAAFRKMLERHIERGLWCRIHYHSIGDGQGSSEANFRGAMDVAKAHEADLWIAGMADVHKYQTERDASVLSLVHSDSDALTFELSCATDPQLYDQPLTIETELPERWRTKQINVSDERGQDLVFRSFPARDSTVLRFEVAPCTAVYTIELRR